MILHRLLYAKVIAPTPGSGAPGEKGAAVGAPGALAMCMARTSARQDPIAALQGDSMLACREQHNSLLAGSSSLGLGLTQRKRS